MTADTESVDILNELFNPLDLLFLGLRFLLMSSVKVDKPNLGESCCDVFNGLAIPGLDSGDRPFVKSRSLDGWGSGVAAEIASESIEYEPLLEPKDFTEDAGEPMGICQGDDKYFSDFENENGDF